MKNNVSDQHWPSDGFERLGECPICGCKQKSTLYDDLTDNTFMCAPGKWSLHRCVACKNAYLDPRPDEKSIGMAYRSYYTHAGDSSREGYAQLGLLRKFRRIISNSYTNGRYGTSYSPSNSWMGVPFRWLPSLRQGLDVQHRWLPKPMPGERLLDVGCGNGAFLSTARRCGWEAYGADPDPAAILQAQRQGNEARIGGISAYADMSGQFKAITLSHSIEHVHDPVKVFREAHKLLERGGVMFVDTPNIDSRGRTQFGRHWRGMETPRHLVLFTAAGLEKVLERAGFTIEMRLRRTSVIAGMFWSSQLIALGRSPYDEPSRTLRLRARVWAALSYIAPSSELEFITLVARRSSR